MAFFSVFAALVLEHVRPLRQPLPHYQRYTLFIQWLQRKLNAGEYSHGAIAWTLAVMPVLIGVWLVFFLLGGISPFLGWVWNVGVLYVTLGFKYFSDDAERIARLLRAGELDSARTQLGAWRGGDASAFSADDIARVTIEQVMAASQRQMFGVLFWFVLLAPLGPVGAVLFRTASILARRWTNTQGRFGLFALRAFHAINWLPARLTALTYAIAGNFEDATFAGAARRRAGRKRKRAWCSPPAPAPWGCVWARASTWGTKPCGGPNWARARPLTPTASTAPLA